MRTTITVLRNLLSMTNQGRASHGKGQLELQSWSDGRRRRYSLTDGFGSRLSPNCTARGMHAVLYTLDELERPWGGQA